MGHFALGEIEWLEKQLRERFDNLVSRMHGRPMSEADLKMYDLTGERRIVQPGNVRIAVDDFATILKEIKATLGKR